MGPVADPERNHRNASDPPEAATYRPNRPDNPQDPQDPSPGRTAGGAFAPLRPGPEPLGQPDRAAAHLAEEPASRRDRTARAPRHPHRLRLPTQGLPDVDLSGGRPVRPVPAERDDHPDVDRRREFPLFHPD